jgi:hypothetical protein
VGCCGAGLKNAFLENGCPNELLQARTSNHIIFGGDGPSSGAVTLPPGSVKLSIHKSLRNPAEKRPGREKISGTSGRLPHGESFSSYCCCPPAPGLSSTKPFPVIDIEKVKL